MRILKRVIIIVLIINTLIGVSALADDKEDGVYIECENLRNALLVLTEDEILTEENLGELDGTVDLSSKGITSLVGIKYLIRADEIVLTNNKITNISPLYDLEYIKEISVNLNNITEIPVGLSSLEYLKQLDISNNPIKQLPSDINDCDKLRWLMIDYCGIEDIGSLDGLGDTLEWLVMPGNPQNDYSFLYGLPELELINLSSCDLDDVPNLTQNINLEYIYLADNSLTTLPDYLSIYRLKRLDASYNYLDDIPDSYINFSRMEQVVLTDNLFREFPTEVLTYRDLDVLMMGYNLLKDVSPGLGILTDLKRLSFTSNDFTSLVTYSEFEIPFSYQLSFTYNRLDLNDPTTLEILEENHNTGGIQKNGTITSSLETADTENVEININGDFDNFNELSDIDYFVKEIIILDNSTKDLLYVIDECTIDGNNIKVTVEDVFTENQSIDWEVILVLSIDTYPVVNLKYLSNASGQIAPAPTATPSPTPDTTSTPLPAASKSVKANNIETKSKIITLIIALLLIITVIYVSVLLIKRHYKKSSD